MTSSPQIAYTDKNILTKLMMEISDGSESLSSKINTDGSFESGDSNISKDDLSSGYVWEPEYNEEELKFMQFSNDTKRNINEEKTDLNPSRQENLDLCECWYFTVTLTFIECKCCREFKDLLDGKVRGV